MSAQILHIVACPHGAWCPAVLDLGGTLAVVGKVLPPELAADAAPHIGPGEAAVMLDPALLEQMVRQHEGDSR